MKTKNELEIEVEIMLFVFLNLYAQLDFLLKEIEIKEEKKNIML